MAPELVKSEPKTISQLSDAVNKALDDVQAKKIALDKANELMAKAGDDYNKSVTIAVDLRARLEEEVNKILPQSFSRVRQSV